MIISTVWLGMIGFVDDYIKIFKKDKKGLAGTKILGQTIIGLLVGILMVFHPDIVVKDKPDFTYSEQNIVSIELARNHQKQQYLFKNNEFDYHILTSIGDFGKEYAWIVFVLIIFISCSSFKWSKYDRWFRWISCRNFSYYRSSIMIFHMFRNLIAADYLNIMYIPNSGELVIYMSAFVGSCIGFMWYNSYPAQVFMGDTGSLSLGGIIAIVSVLIRKELLIPVLCGVFLVENLSVLIQVGYFKYSKSKYGIGRRIFKMAPIHHHYQKLGIHESKIVTPILDYRYFVGRNNYCHFKNKIMKNNIAIIGAGVSGVGAAVLAKKGFNVFVSDIGLIHEKNKNILCKYNIDWEEKSIQKK